MTVRRRTIIVRGDPASFREAGAGAVAIVTAGLGLTSRFYEDSYDAFANAGIHLIVPDLPGWGDTPGPLMGLSAGDTASFLLDFADALGIGRAVWIGHSLGAQAVVELAARRPDRAAGVVLAGPTGTRERWRRLQQMKGLAIEAVRTSPDVIGAVARDYLSSAPTRYLGTWLRHAEHGMSARLRQVQCPALLLIGDADPIIDRDAVELMRHRMPHAHVHWVRGGTHALPRGRADEFNRAVTAFVRANAASV